MLWVSNTDRVMWKSHVCYKIISEVSSGIMWTAGAHQEALSVCLSMSVCLSLLSFLMPNFGNWTWPALFSHWSVHSTPAHLVYMHLVHIPYTLKSHGVTPQEGEESSSTWLIQGRKFPAPQGDASIADLETAMAPARERGISIPEEFRNEKFSNGRVLFYTVRTLLMNMQMWLVPEAGGE